MAIPRNNSTDGAAFIIIKRSYRYPYFLKKLVMRTYYCIPQLPEKVEDQIRLAAERIIVQFSEEAWVKMERMLDDEFKRTEVPEEIKRDC